MLSFILINLDFFKINAIILVNFKGDIYGRKIFDN